MKGPAILVVAILGCVGLWILVDMSEKSAEGEARRSIVNDVGQRIDYVSTNEVDEWFGDNRDRRPLGRHGHRATGFVAVRAAC